MTDVTKKLLLIVLQLIGLNVVSACSPIPGTKQWSKEKTFFNAPAVVIATDVYHSVNASDPPEYVEPEDNYSDFTVDCIMKSGGYTIGRNIRMHEGAVRYGSLCHTTFTKVGTKYVLALEMRPHTSSDRFSFFEPNPLTSGGFEATDEILRIAASVCGLDSPHAAPGAGAVRDVCPTIGGAPCEDGEESTEALRTTTPKPLATSQPFETWPESNSSTFLPAETTDSMETTCDYGEECGPGRSSWTIASVTLLTLCAALACDLVS